MNGCSSTERKEDGGRSILDMREMITCVRKWKYKIAKLKSKNQIIELGTLSHYFLRHSVDIGIL